MRKRSTHTAAVTVPPPLLFFICLAAGFLIDRILPLDIPDLPGGVRIIGGSLFAAVSAGFGLSALTVMVRQKTPFNPAKESLTIVKNGPFGISRNPMYLSLVLMMAGIAFIQSSLWYLGAALILFFLLNHLAIKPEEKYLADKFGKQYRDYKTRVRRWI